MNERKPYFPFFVDLSGAKGLIIGGERKAYHKIQRMLPYGAQLTVIAKEFLPEIETIEGLNLVKRSLLEQDLNEELDFVVVASASEDEKQFIHDYCRQKRIPVNVVDDVQYSSYIYPALIAKGDLSIGISTGGASPTVAAILKEKMVELIPARMDEILYWLESLRPMMKKEFLEERERAKVFRKIAEECMKRNDVLTMEEVKSIMRT